MTIYARSYFWVLDSVPLFYMSVFMIVSYGFDWYSFIFLFEIRKYGDSRFAFLSQDWFRCLRLWFHTNFRNFFFLLLWEISLEYGRDYIESIGDFGEYGHFNNIILCLIYYSLLPVREHRVFFHFFVSTSLSFIRALLF